MPALRKAKAAWKPGWLAGFGRYRPFDRTQLVSAVLSIVRTAPDSDDSMAGPADLFFFRADVERQPQATSSAGI
jgi:hypothetical protein